MDAAAPAELAAEPDAAAERALLRWTAGPELTIVQASAVHAEWLNLLEAGPAQLVLALDAVEEIDSAGIQLLLSLKVSASQRDCDCLVESCSPAVRRALADYRLEAVLGLPPSANGSEE